MKTLVLMSLFLTFSLRAQTQTLPWIQLSGNGYYSFIVTAHVGLKAQNTGDDRCMNVVDYDDEEYRNPHVFHIDAYTWVDYTNRYYLDFNVENRLKDEISRQRENGVLSGLDSMSVDDYIKLCNPVIFQISVLHRDSQLQLRDTPNASYTTDYEIEYGSTRVGDYSFSRAPKYISFDIKFLE
ncbi:MAG: hypothetical protein COW00_03590 [Bdellovibrio sp. CG12_big_fil_rev_8_21_14_0_65_39_13]|nr:MAG: hypothetical protein COW78_14845 [Bdellovibrio sp. CG22_combo_CG10-13_8_21_14_all_39_27]PIQ61446.1 MAG: hypothetical protein COW00_03590 [Bdellovibrio sp. CG12_big_fil_rev_8_21_14_0_65_39_13]PIR35291.1 MAG: hypothetical protein COV37_09355 [Bdellovibrio sp. CG11_big_fil_rev_8_21_14_0_20_39_38]PJB52838.1 MAG: hypothetical protein CO099_10500 [Bdellovibrio sp. CG_4_9_14_3_um_filter_39_7]